MKRFIMLLATAIGMLAGAGGAHAQSSNVGPSTSQVYATTNVNVRSGPGTSNQVIGLFRAWEYADLLECVFGSSWCKITNGRSEGWVSGSFIADADGVRGLRPWGGATTQLPTMPNTRPTPGAQPSPFPAPQTPNITTNTRPTPQPAIGPRVCMFDQANFSGRELCAAHGDSQSALSNNWDNVIRSLRVDDGLEVTICTEPNLRGFCGTFDRSIANLGPFADSISSFRVRFE